MTRGIPFDELFHKLCEHLLCLQRIHLRLYDQLSLWGRRRLLIWHIAAVH